MLIHNERQTAADIAEWERLERYDAVLAKSKQLAKKINEAEQHIRWFSMLGQCYSGTSWGKDSVCMAHMVYTCCPNIPIVWIKSVPNFNPDCLLVRDNFISTHPGVKYVEYEVTREVSSAGHGFDGAVRDFGKRYISGVRAEESSIREMRLHRFGISSKNTCAPMSRWTGLDVFAYLYVHNLPVHPAYACTVGGVWDRVLIRVSSIGGQGGRNHGREEWEHRYYSDVVEKIR